MLSYFGPNKGLATIIVGYNAYVNKGGGHQGFGEQANPDKLKLDKDVVLKKIGKLQVIEDQTDKLYLHIKPGWDFRFKFRSRFIL